MCAMKARGKRGCIVGDHQIALMQQIDELVALDVADVALRIDGQQSGVRRPMDGTIRSRDHLAPPLATFSSGATWRGSEEAMASRSSRAAVSGRLSVDGSASGTASACIGVSMSPGSIERKRIPSEESSSLQMRVMW